MYLLTLALSTVVVKNYPLISSIDSLSMCSRLKDYLSAYSANWHYVFVSVCRLSLCMFSDLCTVRFLSLLHPVGVQGIVINPSVCVSVCLRAYLWNRWTDRQEILSADPLWLWLDPPLAALCYVMYFRFYG